MHPLRWKEFLDLILVVLLCPVGYALASNPAGKGEEVLVEANAPGAYGGHLVVVLRAEPKTLNPVLSNDASSREVISQMTADLIHINPYSQQSKPPLAKSLPFSPDGLHSTLQR